MKGFKLPKDFLLGTATAATQIDGSDYNNNWYYWALNGRTYNGDSPISANDHYNLYERDIDIMNELGHEIYRFSIDWSRVEPQKGTYNNKALEHYRQEIIYINEKGIKPLVTLHHFSTPQWFQEEVGWDKKESVSYFLAYINKVIEHIGDIVEEYCTINEPNVLLNSTYIDGTFPPGIKNDNKKYFNGARNLILAHIKAYKLIHQKRNSMGFTHTMVGFAHHMTFFYAKNPITTLGKSLMQYSFHTIFEKGFIKGKLLPPIGLGFPEGKGLYCDFIGINYYTRHIVKMAFNPATFFSKVEMSKNILEGNQSDMGWEIYPEGLYKVVSRISQNYDLPIYITENGIADLEDTKRAKYIYEHLYQVRRLIDDGVDLRRYYYWSFMDNFEWAEGYWPRFGLLKVDYSNQERHIRDSCKFFTCICKSKAIDDKLISRYLKGVQDNEDSI